MPQRAHSAYLGEGAQVCFVIASESMQHGPLSGAAAETDVASEAQHAPAAGWPGASQTFDFQMFLISEIHPGSASRKNSKSYVGPNVRKLPLAIKRNTFSRITLRVASAAKTKLAWGEEEVRVLCQRLFRTFDKRLLFVKVCALTTTTLEKCARFQ